MVLGSRQFVDAVFAMSREWFGPRRTSGARRLARAHSELRSMRELKVRPYSTPHDTTAPGAGPVP
jgi:hypothetical protein